MATNFPASLDSLTNPTSSDSLNSPSHSAQHANVNDAVEALQAKVGADSSAVTTSLDYKVAQLEAISHGKILQVVSATYSTEITTTSSSYTATPLAATITPSSASSTVLIQLMFPWRASRSGFIYSGNGNFAIYRGATNIHEQTAHQYKDDGGNANRWLHVGFPMLHVDSPATTSATTYTLYHHSSGTTLETFTNNVTGTMVLMEVAA